MSWLDGLRHRLHSVLRPGAYAEELEEEMRFHLELDAMQLRDADRARRRFGNRTWWAEEARRTTWLRWADAARQDLGYAWRGVMRTPAVTAVVVATLALGIGANAATFSVLDTIYLRPPGGVDDPGTLRRFWVEHTRTRDGTPFVAAVVTYPQYREIAAASGDSARMALFTTDDAQRLGRSPRAPRVRVTYASARYFSLLGVRPALGRFYLESEDRLGSGAPVAVVSHAFWRHRLGGDAAVLGAPLAIGADVYTIVGVAEPAFAGLLLQPSDVWIPLAAMPAPTWIRGPWWESHNTGQFRIVHRAAGGVDDRGIEARASHRLRRLSGIAFPGRPDTLMRVHAGPIIEARGPGKRGQEEVISTRLSGVAAIVLLIACANVVNLLLARAIRRRREIALRLALGISRRRLVRLLTTETMLLALVAAAAALLVGTWGGAVLRSLLMPDIEWTGGVMHWRVALFTIAVSVAAGLAAGIVPAVQASDPDLVGALKDGAHGAHAHRSRLRGGLVVAQAALSVILLVGATLFVRSLREVRALDIGFDADRLLFGSVEFPDGETPPAATVDATMRELAQRLASRPGVETVARSFLAPMRGFGFLPFYTGTDSSASFNHDYPTISAVSPEFFRAAGVRLLRGRGFAGGDAGGAPTELVVNEAAARLLWPRRDAVGECMRFTDRASRCYTVVGVAENVRRDRVIEEKPAPQLYVPLAASPLPDWVGTTLIVRARAAASGAAAAEMRAALHEAFPSAEPVVTPMTANLEPEYRPWRLGATLFTSFGALALLVALIGIYSTVSYGVSQRTHEFGVRIALGARIGDVLRQVVGEGLRTVAIGVAVGVALALAAGRLVAALLYGVSPSDPAVLALVPAVLLGVSALAALVPAWRASRVDPVTALRTE